MAEYHGEYGHPYPRVDQYGNPVPPVDQYGNPIPREPAVPGLGGATAAASAPLYGTAGDAAGPGYAAAPGADYGAANPYPSGGVAPGETALAYEGMVGSGGGVIGAATAGMGGQVQPATEERTFGSSQLQPTREEEHTTLGEKLARSGSSSSSSSSSEDDGQGGRRKKKSIKQKIKEKLPGGHKHEEGKAATAGGTTTHAAGAHEKKGLMEKIKEKLPGHH